MINIKRQFVIDELKKHHVTTSQSGKDIELLDYDELKYELLLASFRWIDVENDKNKWF